MYRTLRRTNKRSKETRYNWLLRVHRELMRVCCSPSIRMILEVSFDDANVNLACTISQSTTYSVGVTVTVGADLGLSEIASLGISASISVTTTKGIASTAGITCNGPWTCGLLMTPSLLEVSGVKKTTQRTCEGGTEEGPYTVRFPILSQNIPKANFEACVCTSTSIPNSLAPQAPKPCPNRC